MKSVWAACAVIAALYVLEVVAITHALRYSAPLPHAGMYRAIAGIAALSQAGVLCWLYLVARSTERFPAAPAIACALVMSATSFAFVNPHRDALAYIAYAKQPTFASAYSVPPSYVPPQGFSEVKRAWPVLPNCSYGPLWLWLVRATAGPLQTLDSCMLVMRFIGLLSLVLLFVAVICLRAPPAIGTLTIVNPFWYFFYVLEAHNDGLAIMLAVAAMALAVPRPFLAPVVGGTAALIKAPFVAVAALAFAGARSARGRIVPQLLIFLAVAIGGSLFGGRPYFAKMFSHGMQTYGTTQSMSVHIFSGVHIALAIVALGAIVFALLRARFYGLLSFSFVALSSLPYPWYLGWGLPYAVQTPFVSAFLVLLPIFGFLMNSQPASRLFELAVLLSSIAVILRSGFLARFNAGRAAAPAAGSDLQPGGATRRL